MKTLKNILSAAAIVLTVASCQKDPKPAVSNRVIKANFSEGSVETKSAQPSVAFIGSAKGEGFSLDIYEQEGIITSEAPQTKGTLMTTTNFGSAAVEAWLGEKLDGVNEHYISGGSIQNSGAITMNGAPCYWVNDADMHMWCYLPKDLNLTTTAKDHASFSYDINDQRDVVVSHNLEHYKEGGAEYVDVTMKHALAGVKFNLALLASTKKITKVTFTGLNSSATCTVDKNANFAWSNTAGTASYSYDTEAISSDRVLPKVNDGNQELFFFMPQAFGTRSDIIIDFYDTEKNQSQTLSATLGGHEFKSGHTYTINIKPDFTFNNELVTDLNDISFRGGGQDRALFASLDPKAIDALQIGFDMTLGNNQGGYIKISLVKAGSSELIQTVFCRNCPPNDITVKRAEENNSSVSITNISGKNPKNAHAEIKFNIDHSKITGPFDILFEYDGGNNGAANWLVKNLSLSSYSQF